MAKKKTGVRLGLKNLGIGSSSEDQSGLEYLFDVGTDSAEGKSRGKKTKGSRPTFGEINVLAARPDPDQPRSLLPTSAYNALDQGTDPVEVLSDWLNSESSASPSQQEEIKEIKALAETIQEAGLQQPIGIREIESFVKDVNFAVVFGERRWWAHVYLLSADNKALGQDVGKIKAGIVQPKNLQLVQLIENLHRRDLHALDIAIGLKKSLDQLKANGVKSPGDKLVKATGIKIPQRSRYIHLLELDPIVQQKMRDYNLTENAVRPIADKLRNEAPELQINAINKLISWRESGQPSGTKRLDEYVKELLQGTVSTGQHAPRIESRGVSAFQGPI
ncbi:MAG: ParB N-terminal domain-containing protein, partial [Chloroflexota bacterium]